MDGSTTVETFAARLGMTARHLNRLFAWHLGHPRHQTHFVWFDPAQAIKRYALLDDVERPTPHAPGVVATVVGHFKQVDRHGPSSLLLAL